MIACTVRPLVARSPRLLAVLFALAAVFAAGDLSAQAFVRGDANSDGRVSGSDAHFVLSFLFRGFQAPECQRTADVDDNGSIEITDPVFLLNFLVLGGPPPCEPFPQPGEDAQSALSCREYTPEPPVEDPRYALEVSDAIASADGTTTITLFVTNPASVAGYFGSLVLAGGRFGRVTRVTDVSGTLSGGFAGAQVFGGKIRFGFLSSLIGDSNIEPGERRPGLQIQCCLESGLPAGDYEVLIERPEVTDFASGRAVPPELVPGNLSVPDDLVDTDCVSPAEPDVTSGCGPQDPPDPPCPPDEPALDFVRADINLDGRVSLSDTLRLRDFLFLGGPRPLCGDAADVDDSGTLEIGDMITVLNHVHLGGPAPAAPFPVRGPDPTPTDCFGCASDTITPAEATDDVLALGEATGVPGQTVRIPVMLSNSAPIDGFQMVFRADPGVVGAPGQPSLMFEGSFYDALLHDQSAAYQVVRSIPGEPDVFVAAFIPNFTEPGFEVPPGNDRTVFFVVMRVSEDAVPGTEVRLELTDGVDGAEFGSVGLRNELTSQGASRLPRLASGVIRVVEGEAILRGDSNHDGALELSDSVFTLNFLFLGGEAPPCLDEADVNDDGTVNISDPIGLLGFLFLGEGPPRPPFPEAGVDPTEDGLPQCFEGLE
jgi:hypothetical protein